MGEVLEAASAQTSAEPLLEAMEKFYGEQLPETKPTVPQLWMRPYVYGDGEERLASIELAALTIAALYDGMVLLDEEIRDNEDSDKRYAETWTVQRMGEDFARFVHHKKLSMADARLQDELRQEKKKEKRGELSSLSEIRELSADLASRIEWELERDIRIRPLSKRRDIGRYVSANYLEIVERTEAGSWLMLQAARMLPDYLKLDGTVPEFVEGALPALEKATEKAREQLMREYKVIPFSFEPPLPWTSLRGKWARGLRRGAKPAVKKAMEQPGGIPHFNAAHILGCVPFRIDPVILDAVERHAVDLLQRKRRKQDRKQDQKDVDKIVARARWAHDQDHEFFFDYFLDFRGRLYVEQEPSFYGPDYARALFRFANGVPLAQPEDTAEIEIKNGIPVARIKETTLSPEKGIRWLEINAANKYGHDKKTFKERFEWVRLLEPEIRLIAADPLGTVELWGNDDVDKPFQYLAACRELVGAWDDPKFVSHLPVGFDATSSGLQHQAMLTRDEDTAKLVNLISQRRIDGDGMAELDEDDTQDIYAELATRAYEMIENSEDLRALFWRERISQMGKSKLRKMVKGACIPLLYGAGNDDMARAISRAFHDEFGRYIAEDFKPYAENLGKGEDALPLAKKVSTYLAGKVQTAFNKRCPKAVELQKYIKRLAVHRAETGEFLEWVTPAGLPVVSEYWKPRTRRVHMPWLTRVPVKRVLTVGDSNEINDQVRAKAAPNFVHSLDAAALTAAVLEADDYGVQDIACVHDCFWAHAPYAETFRNAIGVGFRGMYIDRDPLEDLHKRNAGDSGIIFPERGNLNPKTVRLWSENFIT